MRAGDEAFALARGLIARADTLRFHLREARLARDDAAFRVRQLEDELADLQRQIASLTDPDPGGPDGRQTR